MQTDRKKQTRKWGKMKDITSAIVYIYITYNPH